MLWRALLIPVWDAGDGLLAECLNTRASAVWQASSGYRELPENSGREIELGAWRSASTRRPLDLPSRSRRRSFESAHSSYPRIRALVASALIAKGPPASDVRPSPFVERELNKRLRSTMCPNVAVWSRGRMR